jgi:N-acetylneuraminate synthase
VPVKFIAEASSNHGQDLSRALAFVDAAADCGCDAVKFQLFRIAELFAPEILAKSAKHRARATWELPVAHLAPLAERARKRNIEFSCTPFYLAAVKELEPFVAFYKIASYELLWYGLLEACAATGKPVIISTGMATMPEIKAAVMTLKRARCSDITALHCVSAYPAPPEEANLSAIAAIRDETQVPSGWSDHTRSPAVIERAVHRWGASAVEFHLDLDGQGAEYEAGHCWLPQEIAPVIARVREGERADGAGFKGPVAAELSDREWRADPSDGLRPLRHVRATWEPA